LVSVDFPGWVPARAAATCSRRRCDRQRRPQAFDLLIIQRPAQIGYNRAASLMEADGTGSIVGQANHAGKRAILVEEEESGF